MMRRSKKSIGLTFFATLAILLGSIPSAEAGNGWGWKKPMNQKLGAFYTSNKAFKRSTPSSSSYRHSSSYSRQNATPIYSQPASRTVVVQAAPRQQVPVQSPVAGGQIQSAPVQVQSAPVQASAVPTPVAVTSGVSPAVATTPATPNTKPAQKETRSAEEQALELLGSSFPQ